MIPPTSALHIFESSADERERAIKKTRQERILGERPPRPHRTPCDCDVCRRWAHDIVHEPAPEGAK